MPDVAKKTFTLLIIAFLIFYLVSAPQELADNLNGIIDFIGEGFDQIVRFFRAL